MTTANEYQVGGVHYKTAYEHWDFVFDAGLGYFDGQVTRYVTRWRKKQGLADLEKALHYVGKMKELGPRAWPTHGRPTRVSLDGVLRRYIVLNDLNEVETRIVETLALGPAVQGLFGLDQVRDWILHLIEGVKNTPRSDSNKHGTDPKGDNT